MGKHRRTKRSEDETGGVRGVRLQELIREEANLLFSNEIRDPRLNSVSITGVELAGECARLWYWADGDDDKSEALDGVIGFLRSRLAESLGLKRTPDIRFRRDPATRMFVNAERKI